MPSSLTSCYWPVRAFMRRRRKAVRALAAFVWRRLLLRTRFIVVAGSVGKTTTKEMIASVLQSQHPTMRTPGNCNHRKFGGIESTLLKVRPRHRFAVLEAGIEQPGDMASVAKFLKPDIAVMLDVKRCHTNVFKTVEAIAQEKGHLIQALGPKGQAVINQDNPHVVAMLQGSKAKALGFGRSEQAQFRLLEIHSRWPERLRLTVEVNGQRYQVQTRFVGNQAANAVLAALATAHACGVPPAAAIAALERIEPFWARMQPVTLPGTGATLVRDEWNGSIDTFEAAFEFMADARAARKIVVVSDYSDTTTRLRARANQLGRRVAGFADVAVFVGEYADRAATAAIGEGLPQQAVHSFANLPGATAFLKRELRAGDLVLLKGQTNHHLSRIFLGLLGDVSCTLLSCPRQTLCDTCDRLGLEWQPGFRGLMAEQQAFV